MGQVKKFIITRNQFEKIQEVFLQHPELDRVIWKEESASGIGPTVTLEFEPKKMQLDLTDVDSW
jgi:hypothetical protein